MAVATTAPDLQRERDGAYVRLEELILARDQVGSSQVFYDLIKQGRPVEELVREVVRIHAPYTHVPFHQRNDNGQGIMAANVYQIANNPGLTFTAGGVNYIPSTVPSAQASTWQTLYTEVLGIVGQPQSLYTRKLPDLSLQPLGTPANDKSIIPTYSAYVSDIWRIRQTANGVCWRI